MEKKRLRYQTALFDLDGTLIRSGPGIFAAVNAMLKEIGREPRPEEELFPLIGPPIRTGFREILGLPPEDADRQIACYRRHYQNEFHRLIRPFPGVVKMLEELKAAGARIGVVTSKIQPVAAEHIREMGLDRCVEYLCGASEDGSGEKPELLRRAVKELSLDGAALKTAVMVGDRCYDMAGANAVGMDSIGVLYGYGAREELEAYRPRFLARTVEELASLLTGR